MFHLNMVNPLTFFLTDQTCSAKPMELVWLCDHSPCCYIIIFKTYHFFFFPVNTYQSVGGRNRDGYWGKTYMIQVPLSEVLPPRGPHLHSLKLLQGRVCYWAVTQGRSTGLSSVTGFTRSLWAKPTNNSQASCLPWFWGLFQITHWLFEVIWRTSRVFPCISARKRLGHPWLCHPPAYREWPLNKTCAYLGIWSERL